MGINDKIDILFRDGFITPNEVRKLLGIEPPVTVIPIQHKTHNCPNCGAPITSWKCGYCDTILTDDVETTTLYADNVPVCVVQHFDPPANGYMELQDYVPAHY